MPRACLLFDESITSGLLSVSLEMAATSAFKPVDVPLHIALIGSLHVYSEETVREVLRQPHPPVVGSFIKWEIVPWVKQLRAIVQLDESMVKSLEAALPKGKAWAAHYVVLGSVEGIDESQYEAFLAAVQRVLPLDGTTSFTQAPPRLEYHNEKTPPQKKKEPHPAPQPPTASSKALAKRQQKELLRQQKEMQRQQKTLARGETPSLAPKLSREQRRAFFALQENGRAISKLVSRNAANRRVLAAASRAAAVQRARLRGMEAPRLS